MNDWQRSLAVLGAAFVAVGLATMLVALLIAGGPSSLASRQPNGSPSPSADGTAEPIATTGIGGALQITGDRTEVFVLDREVINDFGYALAGPEGQIRFTAHPAAISRIEYDGLTFFVEPTACALAPGERDEATGLAPVGLTCEEMAELRGSATISITGTVRLPADMAGVRGDLPETGGELSVGDEVMTFAEARLDLRRPEVIETRPGFSTRNPVVYPVTIAGSNATLEFEYDVSAPDLRLIGVTIDEGDGQVVGDGCVIDYQPLAELSRRVTVVEMTLDCPWVEIHGVGEVALSGTLVVDIAEFPASDLR